jgi:hypothetical protein
MPSILKVNQIQKTSSTSNIINKSGSTITLGSCGTTVTLACGATQSGFAASSFVDWCTTAKTAPFTGANGTGYFVNTSCGAITVTLPATPTAGDIVSLKDYGGTWATNNVTICGNSSKINGVCATATLNTDSQSVTLIYVDATKGWQDIQDSTSATTGQIPYIVATGGTVTTCGDYKIHTFTSDSTFCVSAISCVCAARNKISYVVVAGGGGASPYLSGGAGAGGFREGKCSSDPYTASPKALTPCSSLPVSVQAYPITVGGGGSGGPAASCSTNGSNSIFSSITSSGGGRGGDVYYPSPGTGNAYGFPGGSGGGGAADSGPGGSGNVPPVSPPQGNGGGTGAADFPSYGGGGGGGATGSGGNGTNPAAGNGGTGAGTGINPSPSVGTTGPSAPLRYFAGGGGGNAYSLPTSGSGGYGGGGNGGASCNCGVVNTGGGAGKGAAGGSGIVIIRYRYQ